MTHLIKLIILLLNSSITKAKASATETVGTLRLYLPNTSQSEVGCAIFVHKTAIFCRKNKLKKSLFGQRLKIED